MPATRQRCPTGMIDKTGIIDKSLKAACLDADTGGNGSIHHFGGSSLDFHGQGFVMQPRLRLFRGEDTQISMPGPSAALSLEPHAAPLVSMKLDELVGILVDAARTKRAWLADFADDEVRIPGDLFEVMTAYSHLRPSA
ncbi:MAG: hypothetical protein O3A00_22895 [Planctomycetota bacterium]|nr:hypothetical protein [Planctomycetota bacterium]